MPIPIVDIETDGVQRFFCPFTGEAVESAEDGVRFIPTLLFVYYGAASIIETENKIVTKLVKKYEESEIEEDQVDWIASKLDVEGAFVLRVDTGWNGVNAYGFMPVVASQDLKPTAKKRRAK